MSVELTETGITTKVFTTIAPKVAKGRCPNCDTPLELRRFVDARGPNDKPTDINEDLYCPKCDIRWQQEPGPHDFQNKRKFLPS